MKLSPVNLLSNPQAIQNKGNTSSNNNRQPSVTLNQQPDSYFSTSKTSQVSFNGFWTWLGALVGLEEPGPGDFGNEYMDDDDYGEFPPDGYRNDNNNNNDDYDEYDYFCEYECECDDDEYDEPPAHWSLEDQVAYYREKFDDEDDEY